MYLTQNESSRSAQTEKGKQWNGGSWCIAGGPVLCQAGAQGCELEVKVLLKLPLWRGSRKKGFNYFFKADKHLNLVYYIRTQGNIYEIELSP